MNNLVLDILKYFDLFGTNFNFYTEKNRKFYTPLGGLLTIFAIIFGIIAFFNINLEDFSHNAPISTTSTVRESYKNIKFKEEKIWIPWRVRDYNSKTINHSDLFYPIVYYYKGIRNNTKEGFRLSYDIINYTLCNETSMKNNSDSFLIDIELDQLYCIDMDDLYMGGSWDYNFINYVEFDLYLCKDGINFDENNENCSSFEKIIEYAKEDNSFEFEIYYPVVHYQPMNKTTPIFVRYYNYFYHLSRFSNKIDRIYLQKYILKDDKGWLVKNEKYYTHWGYITLSGDSYATGEKKDLMNEGSSSRLYSFNIYLKSDVVYYSRSYKKLLLIFANGLPIVNVVFIIFKLTAKIFKISSGNKKLTELLFENLQEKPVKNKTEKRVSILQYKQKKLNSEKRVSNKRESMHNSLINKNYTNKNISSSNNNLNDASSVNLGSLNEQNKKRLLQNINKRKNSMGYWNHTNNKSKFFQNFNNQINNQNKTLNSSIKNNNNVNYAGLRVNNNMNISIHNNAEEYSCIKNNEVSSTIQLNKSKIRKKFSEENKSNIKNSILKPKLKTHFIQKKLFPYKYYLCSIFIKNIDISKKSIFFTRKFIVVYNFICQLFDISSYLILQKEFQIMKNTVMMSKERDILESRQKINVNDYSFNTDMKECLDSQKFYILGKVKQSKGI